MDLAELTAYALERYQIREERRWADFPGLSVLCDPSTGKYAALLMRQWDENRGEELQLCDIRCGAEVLREFSGDWLCAPFRMKGSDWVGVRPRRAPDPEEVFRLLDRALELRTQRGYILVLDHSVLPAESRYQDTALPRRSPQPERAAEPKRSAPVPQGRETRSPIPARLKQMRRLTDGYSGSVQQTCRDFYVQGKFMEDYEDDVPWRGDFRQYFPTYEDLTLQQLRGYFTWRTHVRRGEYERVPASLAYIYIYELLNGIGADSPEDSLAKLAAFEKGFLDTGYGDQRIRGNLRRWMPELAVVSGLPPETVRQYADPELLRMDGALAALRRPEKHTDGEVFNALCLLGSEKLADSPIARVPEGRGVRLMAEIWRKAAAEYREQGSTLFTLCFGSRRTLRWHPLENAVYWVRKPPEVRECVLDECRTYLYQNGAWREKCYHKQHFEKQMLGQLLHEAERRLRLYLKAGRTLLEKPGEAWAAPYIEAALEADRQAALEAARPKVVIDFSGLDRIRQDAGITRDSLLTEEDLRESAEPSEAPAPAPVSAPAPPPEAAGPEPPASGPSLPLDDTLLQLLRMLLRGEPVRPWLDRRRLMATVAADALNEALFDELGDSAVDCDGEDITLIDDYRGDLLRLLGGEET